MLIWTTTPWTIPSNLAIAFHPDFEYGAYEVELEGGAKGEKRVLILATGLAKAVEAATKKPLGEPLATVNGATFEYIKFKHPLYDRVSIGVLGGLRHARRRARARSTRRRVMARTTSRRA